ncbi:MULTISPECIES: SMP-30/gluconolactonase/LRE family protein [unclassified Bradyrhizobium]|uniref:SMP-30/gluconolactonase/LRE family protein n=1 Tax=unclassified Bradyrhizobium TaxID=2631580 RepID=UPI00247922ED|nr:MULTISPECIES: SMP-30/gluconolactonase/LRE family protein [unclassified Bradyrhizobium]WGS19741.1 SMP-30/gluconolactonase/LRE family protein [Bradyrhizobium sp. ISRA463]WGS26585.1 SMP-30/gluconolactonase/LRE family protein [Bradyrhizobium sp. ISRA464]
MTTPLTFRDHDNKAGGLARRTLLKGAAAALAATAATKASAAEMAAPLGETGAPTRLTGRLPLGPLPGSRYPDPHVENAKKPQVSFGAAGFPGFAGTTAVERVATGMRWAEGPVYFAAGRYVLFSDIPNNRIMRFCEDDGHLSVYRQPSMNSNGNTIDREGRLITCEHSGRRVTRTELDGSITIIADKYNGKKLNSPNDAAVASDGSIWFTDPVYGIGGYYEGIKAEPEQAKHNVFRVDPKSGDIKVVVDDFVEPNGIALSPDEKKLYVIDTGFTDSPSNPCHIRVFDVDVATGKVSNGKVVVEIPKPGITDGMRLDTAGNVWCSSGWGDPNEDGVRCYTPGGDLLGKIHIPETVANLCFGGQQRNRLYICGSTSLYAVYTSAVGALKP